MGDEVNNNNIKKINKIAIILNTTLMFLIVILVQNIKIYDDKIDEIQNDRFNMVLLANILRKNSDDLTRFARNYVITSNIKFKKQYFDTLNIRNGVKNKSENFTIDNGDLKKSENVQNHSDAKIFSFKELIKKLSYSKEEIVKILSTCANFSIFCSFILAARKIW